MAQLRIALGILLILTGALVPSATVVSALRTTPGELLEPLLHGGMLFKAGLIILGIFVIAVSRMTGGRLVIQSVPALGASHGTYTLAALIAILVAASVLRFYHLDAGLWYDEILMYMSYMGKPIGEIVSLYDSENQHCFYTLLARLALQLFGESAWAVRLPAVLFGVGSLGALYLLGREVSSPREALLSTALLGLSYHHIWFSQNARGYTGLLFWTILASYLFVRGYRETRPRFWLLYAYAVALGVYTHITMLFVVFGHFVIYLARLYTHCKELWPHRWTSFVLGFCLAGLLTFQLYALILPQVFSGVREESHVGLWKQPLWTLLEFVRGMQVSFSGSVVALVACVIFGSGVWSFARTSPVVLQFLGIPSLIGLAIVLAMGHHLWPRFFFFAMGFGILVIVRGTMVWGHVVARLFNLAPTKSALLGTVLCTGLILVSALSIPAAYGPKQDYLGALNFVEGRKEPGDAIVTVGLATLPYKSLYKVNWEAVETLDTLNAIRTRAKRTWLLYTFSPQVQAVYPKIMASIQRDFTIIKQFYGTVGNGTIFVCRSDLTSS